MSEDLKVLAIVASMVAIISCVIVVPVEYSRSLRRVACESICQGRVAKACDFRSKKPRAVCGKLHWEAEP